LPVLPACPGGRRITASSRRLFVGHRADHEAMNQAVSANRLRPVIDRVFDFTDAREAYAYYVGESPLGKVIISVGGR
jgi:NADPH:quinone reductase-like Zn-dependent oxidoreductase